MNSDPTPPQIDVAGQEIVPEPVKNVTPITWRLAILAAIAVVGSISYFAREAIGLRGQAFLGCFVFFGIVAFFSVNLRAVNWKGIGWGIGLQLTLAVLVLKVDWFKQGAQRLANVFKSFIDFSDAGGRFVFGNLATPGDIALNPGVEFAFIFAFKALPPIIFVSAFFTMLYHFGVLQKCVQLLALIMRWAMGTSGAETLSVAANVFMGQTEAPLIVRPYVPRMTRSELFALMTSGFAHISGGMMVVYISYGADAVAVLTTCIMACPGSLYLAKLFMPETGVPETKDSSGLMDQKSQYANAIDAISAGTKDGLQLALNVGAMLIAFTAFVFMINAIINLLWPGMSLDRIFAYVFSPAAFLMGVELNDVQHVGTLLGTKLSQNEHVAYLAYKTGVKDPSFLSHRSQVLTSFALTGFANFASIGIQLGGIGAMAPTRRAELARIGGRALFVGFVATLLNAAIAGILID